MLTEEEWFGALSPLTLHRWIMGEILSSYSVVMRKSHRDRRPAFPQAVRYQIELCANQCSSIHPWRRGGFRWSSRERSLQVAVAPALDCWRFSHWPVTPSLIHRSNKRRIIPPIPPKLQPEQSRSSCIYLHQTPQPIFFSPYLFAAFSRLLRGELRTNGKRITVRFCLHC